MKPIRASTRNGGKTSHAHEYKGLRPIKDNNNGINTFIIYRLSLNFSFSKHPLFFLRLYGPKWLANRRQS